MRINLLCLLILSILFSTHADAQHSSPRVVQVYEEPMHKLVFEKGPVKVLDVQIKPHDTTQFHIHNYPMFFVSLGWQINSGQLLNAEWSTAGEAWPKGGIDSDTSFVVSTKIHRVTNNGDTTSRLIGIVNTGKGMSERYDTTGYEISNRWFRAKRILLNKGATLPSYRSAFPLVLVVVSKPKYTLVHNNKRVEKDKVWLYPEPSDKLINTGENALEIIAIEILN